MALRHRLSPDVPLSWDVLGQRDATVRYQDRQENLALIRLGVLNRSRRPWPVYVGDS